METMDLSLNCDILSGLDTKTENQCLQDDASSFRLFQENKVDRRLQLNSDDYFRQFKTVAFREVRHLSYFLSFFLSFFFLIFFFLIFFLSYFLSVLFSFCLSFPSFYVFLPSFFFSLHSFSIQSFE